MFGCVGCERDLIGLGIALDERGTWGPAQPEGPAWHPSCAMTADPEHAGLIRSYVVAVPS